MKYKKNEAKEAAKEMLRGVWTALPTSFIDAERLDEKGIASNLEHSITHLKIDGHYCIGNVGEFWAMTNEERMRVVEINVDVNKGRVPLIAGCHHQNPLEAAKLSQHAQDAGADFVIILTPYMAARGDDAVFDYYKFVADRVDIGICLFNTNQGHPLSANLAKRLATIPNICGYKQGVSGMAQATTLRNTVGNVMEVSVAEEAPWLYNVAVCGDHWLLNYCPHLYQVPRRRKRRHEQSCRSLQEHRTPARHPRPLDPRLRQQQPHGHRRTKILDGTGRHGRRPGARALCRDD